MRQPASVPDLFKHSRDQWIIDTRRIARELLAYRETITIEDVLERCPRPGYFKPNITGIVFKSPEFIAVGVVQSRRRISKKRLVQIWRLRNNRVPTKTLIRNYE